jgi:hypothetical protein
LSQNGLVFVEILFAVSFIVPSETQGLISDEVDERNCLINCIKILWFDLGFELEDNHFDFAPLIFFGSCNSPKFDGNVAKILTAG